MNGKRQRSDQWIRSDQWKLQTDDSQSMETIFQNYHNHSISAKHHQLRDMISDETQKTQ